MNIGFGSLDQMNKTLKYNRAILPKRKSMREIYREEIKKRVNEDGNYDLDAVRERVSIRARKGYVQEKVIRYSTITICVLLLAGVVWALTILIPFRVKPDHSLREQRTSFGQLVYPQGEGVVLKVEFHRTGPRAAETYYLNGRKHYSSESFYESGERFRFAEYYQDTLLSEYFFMKSGDTISNFPVVDTIQVYHITLPHKKSQRLIEFDYWKGKVISGSYVERDRQ